MKRSSPTAKHSRTTTSLLAKVARQKAATMAKSPTHPFQSPIKAIGKAKRRLN